MPLEWYVVESNARPKAADGGAAIQPELLGPVICERRTASRKVAPRSREALAWVAAWSDHQRCWRWGPSWAVIRLSRTQAERGSTLGLTRAEREERRWGWSGKTKWAVSRRAS